MKGSKESLASYLTSQFEKNILDKKQLRAIADYIVNDGNLPVIEVMDALTLRRNAEDYPDRMLYWLTKGVDPKALDKYFSQKEIQEYETTKFEKETIKFPIKWDMIEVVEGSQWIGKITLKELMRLRNGQLISYNERTQRTLRHVEKNKDFGYYQIFLNRKAVNEITEAFYENRYIPNTITLNLPQDAEFTYKDGKLIIKHTDRFDILDGYHRYIAMSNLYNRNDWFDYPMELRVVCFSEENARQFIWQEDQKTKMKKMDSDSFNQNSPAIQVINLINQESFYRNVIGRNEAIIDQGLAANLIELIYFNTRKRITRGEILQVEKNIVSHFNAMLAFDPTIFDKPWDYEFTVITFALFDYLTVNKDLYRDIKKLTDIMRTDPKLRPFLGKKGNPVNTRILTRVRETYNTYFNSKEG